MIKSKSINKFYIKQYILNNYNNFQEWSDMNYSNIHNKDAIIGYLFSVKEGNRLCETSYVLNLYLIKHEYYNGKEITINDLKNAWELFFIKCKTESSHTKKNLFANPPVEQWIDTKENWCKKLATQLSKQFDKSYDDTLSEIYYNIVRCYNKGNVYMGNLGYLRKTVVNALLMEKRANKNKIIQDNGNAISLDTVIIQDSDDEETTLMDMLEIKEEMTEDSLEYKEIKEKVVSMLSDTFSLREIDQLINNKQLYLPRSLYSRLLRWRKKHSIEEVYE